MEVNKDNKQPNNRTIGRAVPLVQGLLILSIISLGACSMPSPTSGGQSSSGGATSSGGSGSPGGGVPNPGGGVPNPGGGSPGGGTVSPSGTGNEGAADSGGQNSGESDDSIEGLDEALDESLEDFDETVMSGNSGSGEIDILSPTGTSGGVDSDEPLFEEVDSGTFEGNQSIEERAAEGAPPATSGDGSQPAQGQASSSSGPQQADGDIIPIPDDIDDGQGDDIVLRQIRDAALKERDPVLREKLWDEYRRIKGQG